MLGQVRIGKALELCESPLEVEEVLSAYAVHKFQRGASAPLALRKLHLLILYLRVTDRAHIVNKYQDVFGLIGTELTFTPQRLGVNPALTPMGKELFNELRRHAKMGSTHTDAIYCGPGSVSSFATPEQSRSIIDSARRRDINRSAWTSVDQYFNVRPKISAPSPAYESAGPSELPTYELARADRSEPLLLAWDVVPPPEADYELEQRHQQRQRQAGQAEASTSTTLGRT